MLNLLSSIQNGTLVTFRYKLTDAYGSVLFNNLTGKPISYIHGRGKISHNLEKNMAGLLPGDTKSFVIQDEFYEETTYSIQVMIDSVENMQESGEADCGKNCNCK